MAMKIDEFYAAEFAEHRDVVEKTAAACKEPFAELLRECVTCVEHGGKILLFGNGGSAADCQHLATELTIRYKDNRAPIAAIALTTDTSALTAGGNDLGFDHIFARQIDALGKPGDIAIGISTSGQSPNVLLGLEMAKSKGLVAAAFGGKDGGKLRDVAHLLIVVPSNTTARIQEMHIMIGQMLCGALEVELGLV